MLVRGIGRSADVETSARAVISEAPRTDRLPRRHPAGGMTWLLLRAPGEGRSTSRSMDDRQDPEPQVPTLFVGSDESRQPRIIHGNLAMTP